MRQIWDKINAFWKFFQNALNFKPSPRTLKFFFKSALIRNVHRISFLPTHLRLFEKIYKKQNMDFFLDQLATSYLVRIGFVGAGGGQPKE